MKDIIFCRGRKLTKFDFFMFKDSLLAFSHSLPGESVLSQKVIDYFQKCFSYCLTQNKGDPEKMRKSLIAIVPHAFGEHKTCEENRLSWCKWLQNPDTYSHKDLPNGKDLTGEHLQKNLTKVLWRK